MAKFRVRRRYTMPKTQVREAARGLAERLEREHGVRTHWEGDAVSISGRGVQGTLSFGDGEIDVSVKLGLAASLFASRLRERVERYLDEYVH